MVFQLLGGIGLFLLGMILLTDGLKAFAGESLRKALLHFTGRPVTAFVSGVTVTALVQSSSATTLATIGFVSAGLLSFSQAIGVVMGASLGTTSTGWIVSTIGLKFSVGMLALPLTGIGAFLKLMGRGKWPPLGLAIAGFGLIFIGIDSLQEGMRHLADVFDLGRIPHRGFLGHFLLLLIGVAMTVIMQSSSAAVATTLAALHAGAIGFEQAASLLIGQAIGTTVTAAIAAIGATVPAKRTALAHVAFNSATGLIALIALPLFLWVFERYHEWSGNEPGAVALAAFHTSFIALGVAIFLPFTRQFARVIERILPDEELPLTRHLDPSLHTVPAVALEAGRNALRSIADEHCQQIERLLQGKPETIAASREKILHAIEETRHFLAAVPLTAGEEATRGKRVALFHALDHLSQMVALPLVSAAPRIPNQNTPAEPMVKLTLEALQIARQMFENKEPDGRIRELEELSRKAAEQRKGDRRTMLESVSTGEHEGGAALKILDYIRWLDSAVYHAWRIVFYLSGEKEEETRQDQSPTSTSPTP